MAKHFPNITAIERRICMKKNYTEPEVQMLILKSADILLASGEDTIINVSRLYPDETL